MQSHSWTCPRVYAFLKVINEARDYWEYVEDGTYPFDDCYIRILVWKKQRRGRRDSSGQGQEADEEAGVVGDVNEHGARQDFAEAIIRGSTDGFGGPEVLPTVRIRWRQQGDLNTATDGFAFARRRVKKFNE